MGKVIWTQWQGFEDGVLKPWQAVILQFYSIFLGNLKEGRENLWDKDNCLAIEKKPQQQFFKYFEMMCSFIMPVKS